MNKVFKRYLIPHEGNDYKPHIFRGKPVILGALFAIAVFAFSLGYSTILSQFDYIASVLPSVLVDLVNDDRSLYDLTPLTRNATLEVAAVEKARDMAQYSYFSHTSPTGITPWYWFTKAGYRFIYAGENLAINFTDSKAVNQAWMNSAGHRANILSSSFSEIGIATAEGYYEGHPTTFVVQLFGRPVPIIEKVSVSPPPNPNVVTIVEDNNYLAVRNTNIPEATIPTLSIGGETAGITEYSAVQDRVLTSPQTFLQIAYYILLTFVLLAIILSLSIELKKHHAKHLISGVLLVMFILALTYVYQYMSGTPVLVI